MKVEDEKIHAAALQVQPGWLLLKSLAYIYHTVALPCVHGKVGSRNISWLHSAEKRTTSVTTESRKQSKVVHSFNNK